MLSDDAARAARRARVLAAVAEEPQVLASPTVARTFRRPGGWLSAAAVVVLSVIATSKLYRRPAPLPPITSTSIRSSAKAAMPAPPPLALLAPVPQRRIMSPPPPATASRPGPSPRAPDAPQPLGLPPATPGASAFPQPPPLPIPPSPPHVETSGPPLAVPPAPAMPAPAPPPAPPGPAMTNLPPAWASATTGSNGEKAESRPGSAAAETRLYSGGPFYNIPSAGSASSVAKRSSDVSPGAAPPSSQLSRNAARLGAAAGAGRIADVQTLLLQGVPVDAPDETGATALMRSIQADRPAVAALLLRYGASLDRTNKAGKSARVMAATKGDAELNQAIGLGR